MIINSKHVGGGADPVINPLTVTENGTYTAPSGVDGYSPINVLFGSHNLPAEYTELAYIESSGTQYINTEYVANADTQIEVKSMRTASQGFQSADWGSYNPVSLVVGIYWAWGNAGDKTGSFNPDTLTTLPYLVNGNTLSGSMDYSVDITGVYNSQGTKIVDFGEVTWTDGQNPIIIMGVSRNGGVVTNLCRMRLMYWAAKENGVYKRKLYPALRKADSVLGLYDIVNDIFYTNAGTGEFTGGALE